MHEVRIWIDLFIQRIFTSYKNSFCLPKSSSHSHHFCTFYSPEASLEVCNSTYTSECICATQVCLGVCLCSFMVGVTQRGRGARCPPGRLNVKACISVFGISGVSADLIAWPICKHFLYVFNRNVRLSVLDKYPQVYHLSTQGAQNSFPSLRGAFVGLASQTKFQTQIQMWSTRNQCSFCPSVFCFIL